MYMTLYILYLALLSCSYLLFHKLASFFFLHKLILTTFSSFSIDSISGNTHRYMIVISLTHTEHLPLAIEFTTISGLKVLDPLSNP